MIRKFFGLTQKLCLQNFRETNLIRTHTLPYQNIRTFAGLGDRFQKKQIDKAKDEFKKEIDFMANKSAYTLFDFRQRVLDGLARLQKGIKAKFMSGNEQEEQSLLTQKKILNAMFDDELKDPFSHLNGILNFVIKK